MDLRTKLIRHQVFLQRLIKNQVKSLTPTLRTSKNIIESLLDSGASHKKLATVLEQSLNNVYGVLEPSLVNIAVYEAGFQSKLLKQETKKNIKIPSPETTAKVMQTSVTKFAPEAAKGLTSKQAVKSYSNFVANKVVRSVKDAELLGIERSIAKKEAISVVDRLSKARLLSLVGTLVNSAAVAGRDAVYQENKIETVIWRTELDSDVCSYCEGLEGDEFSSEEFADECPAHANCRCYSEPVLDE